ncbi:riboflavin kinase [Patescibacteria group bacterium]|nr:riboflavin kinase [Patescibacteria group bacterium]
MKIRGKVIKGAGLGYKTANLKVDQRFDLADGVYLAKVIYQNKEYSAMAIMGIRQDIEIYLLDFDGDLYNQTLEVEVLDKMRDLVKYEKKEDLLKKIQEDVERAKEYFNNSE